MTVARHPECIYIQCITTAIFRQAPMVLVMQWHHSLVVGKYSNQLDYVGSGDETVDQSKEEIVCLVKNRQLLW